MLHGLAGHAGEWSPVVAPLRDTRHVLLLDQRGIQPGVTQTVLYGQSLGGHTAMLLAAHHPDLVSELIMIEAGQSALALSSRR